MFDIYNTPEDMVKYRFKWEVSSYYDQPRSRVWTLRWPDDDIGRLAYCRGAEPIHGTDKMERIANKLNLAVTTAFTARERLVRHKESRRRWQNNPKYGHPNCIENIKYWMGEARELGNRFGLIYPAGPTKEQWKAIALRYKKMYHLENVLRPMARRLIKGKD